MGGRSPHNDNRQADGRDKRKQAGEKSPGQTGKEAPERVGSWRQPKPGRTGDKN